MELADVHVVDSLEEDVFEHCICCSELLDHADRFIVLAVCLGDLRSHGIGLVSGIYRGVFWDGEGDDVVHGLVIVVPDSEDEMAKFSVVTIGLDCISFGIELNTRSLNGVLGQLSVVAIETEQLWVWEQRCEVVVRQGKILSYDDKNSLH